MASNTGAEVSSKALIGLQSNLIALSKNLEELYNALHDNKTKLSEEWRDEKYNEFAEEFEQSERVISELSEKYSEWANNYLPPRINAVIEIENARGTLGTALSVTSEDGVSGSSDASGPSSSGKAAEFRRGIDRLKAKVTHEEPPTTGGPNGGSDAGGFGQNERERLWSLMNQKTR